jgi:nickel-dependent lactate racemase
MRVQLAYGREGLSLEVPDERTVVIEPSPRPGLTGEKAAVLGALEHPIEAAPLRTWLKPGGRVCITFSDITRATPNDRLIPWLLEYLGPVPPEQIVLVNQLGTHRPNTRAELEQLLTPAVVRKYRVLNHEAENPEALVAVGSLRDGTPALINRHVVEADVRIVTGFIEPHFFAGFSGGPKGIAPGCAGLRTIQSNHGPEHMAHPRATFGQTEGNPLWEELRDVALRVGPSFLLNVTLNAEREITGVFAGDLVAAHRAGTEFVRSSAMQEVQRPFEVVVTTNSGYPLDLNLYQGIKGLSAAARIVQPGGLIVLACECSDGVPSGTPFEQLLHRAKSPDTLLALMRQPGFSEPEQWQAQILAQIQQGARVMVHSRLPHSVLEACHLAPCADLSAAVAAELRRCGPAAQVAVLPHGPLTIPYLGSAAGSLSDSV